jgi:hypothetical protein
MANSSFPHHVCLFVFAVMLASATMAFGALSLDRASFTIINQIDVWPATIRVNCWNRRLEIAVQLRDLAFREHVSLVFKPNFWGKSWYMCGFSSSWNRTASFEVWTDNYFLEFWKKRPCNICTWTVTQDSFTEHDGGEIGLVVEEHVWHNH